MHVEPRAGMTALFCLGWALAGAVQGAAAATSARSPVVLPGEHAYPESVTSSADGTLYIGSLGAGGIWRARPGKARAEPWIAPGAAGSRSILGVLVDERSGTLWACSNDLSAYGVHVAGSDTAAALKGFDLRTGAGTVTLALPGARPLCNDIAVGPDGAVYVTDSGTGAILRLAQGSRALETWATDPRFATHDDSSVDGIAFGADGALYVATYSRGEFFRIDQQHGRAGAVTRLTLSRPLEHPDGMRRVRGTVFALVEGTGRLDLVDVSGTHATVDTVREGLAGPTAVTIVGSTAWVAEGQLDSLFAPPGKALPPHLPFSVSATALPPAPPHHHAQP